MISLIGARGSGKTTVGRALAERLARPFADADAECERRMGGTIADVFAAEGEAAFRAHEEATIAALLDGPDGVLATGGGAVLSGSTRGRLRAAGPVVWLTGTADELAARVAADGANDRPSLSGQDPAAEMASVLTARRPLYQEIATITEPTGGRTPDAIAASIAARLAEAGP